jgi:hypothetical protein
VCAFFGTREEEYAVMLAFLQEGLEAKERIVQIMDPKQRVERQCAVTDAGVNPAAAEKEGMIEMRSWHYAYLTSTASIRAR